MSTTPQTPFPKIDREIPPPVRKQLRLIWQQFQDHFNAIKELNTKVGAASTTASTSSGTASPPSSGRVSTEGSQSGGRSATAPTGQTSPNSSALANTASSYSIGAYISGVNPQSGTSYAVQNSDYNGLVVFDTTSAVAVQLNSDVKTNFQCSIFNIGSAQITLTPTSGTVNGVASVTLQTGSFAVVYFDGLNWWVLSFTGVLPATFVPIVHEFLTGYNATSGAFSAAQPAFSDLSGTATPGQLPSATAGAEGIVQLDGDLGGTAASPEVTNVHLSAPLPTAQGGTGSTNGQSPSSGATGARPSGLTVGFMFFDTTLGKPVWYTGSGATNWVDATGASA